MGLQSRAFASAVSTSSHVRTLTKNFGAEVDRATSLGCLLQPVKKPVLYEATTSRLSERIVQSHSSLGAGMRRFHEAPAAAVAALKASELFDDRRMATTNRRVPGPIQSRRIR